jgi:hypothetical protein
MQSIDDNASYIDGLKKQFGKQLEFHDLWKRAIGNDTKFWLLPTRPELKTNLFERVWPKKEVRAMMRENRVEMPEAESDPEGLEY